MGNPHEVDVDAKSRLRVAIKLRRRGMGWEDIAQRCNYKNGDVARITCHRALEKSLRGEIESWRNEEVDRLNTLLAAVWDRASSEIDVDLAAQDRAYANIALRARFLGTFQQNSEGVGAAPVKRQYVGIDVEHV